MQTLQRKAVYTTGEVARICHVAPRTVSKWVDTGQLRGYRIPGSRDRRIPVEHLLAFMRAYGIPQDQLDGGLCRILIVDPGVGLETVDSINASERCEVRTAANEFEAGLLSTQFRPHAIVLDVSGSMEEAAATCRNIKDNPALAGTKVIAAGDGLSPQSQQWLRQQGFDQCTSKQYTPARLAEAVGEP